MIELGGIVAENMGSLALYCESTMKAATYENRAVLKRRYENRALLIRARRSGGFHTRCSIHAANIVKKHHTVPRLGVVLTVCGKVVGVMGRCVCHTTLIFVLRFTIDDLIPSMLTSQL